jgi:hypothetical protein
MAHFCIVSGVDGVGDIGPVSNTTVDVRAILESF